LHGFTQTSRSWDPFIEFLDPQWTIVRVDLPGHGASNHADANLDETADLVATTCGRGIYLGYSMGGRVALHLALQHPHLTSSLALIGATPGIEEEHERVTRLLADEELADSIERDGVSAFINRWLSNPMFDRLPKTATDIADRNLNTATGLARSLRHAGTGTQRPLWPQLSTLKMPTALIAGEEDHKFAAIAQKMTTAIGSNAKLHLIAQAGHTAHLEQPAAVSAIINAL
jgi:2-succinyl-6-hydroxy-2,4-cyclohexadiene-1-carboxylate synthase